MQGDTVLGYFGVCSFCQQKSKLILFYDDDDNIIIRLDFHASYRKTCEGSYSIPETIYKQE